MARDRQYHGGFAQMNDWAYHRRGGGGGGGGGWGGAVAAEPHNAAMMVRGYHHGPIVERPVPGPPPMLRQSHSEGLVVPFPPNVQVVRVHHPRRGSSPPDPDTQYIIIETRGAASSSSANGANIAVPPPPPSLPEVPSVPMINSFPPNTPPRRRRSARSDGVPDAYSSDVPRGTVPRGEHRSGRNGSGGRRSHRRARSRDTWAPGALTPHEEDDLEELEVMSEYRPEQQQQQQQASSNYSLSRGSSRIRPSPQHQHPHHHQPQQQQPQQPPPQLSPSSRRSYMSSRDETMSEYYGESAVYCGSPLYHHSPHSLPTEPMRGRHEFVVDPGYRRPAGISIPQANVRMRRTNSLGQEYVQPHHQHLPGGPGGGPGFSLFPEGGPLPRRAETFSAPRRPSPSEEYEELFREYTERAEMASEGGGVGVGIGGPGLQRRAPVHRPMRRQNVPRRPPSPVDDGVHFDFEQDEDEAETFVASSPPVPPYHHHHHHQQHQPSRAAAPPSDPSSSEDEGAQVVHGRRHHQQQYHQHSQRAQAQPQPQPQQFRRQQDLRTPPSHRHASRSVSHRRRGASRVPSIEEPSSGEEEAEEVEEEVIEEEIIIPQSRPRSRRQQQLTAPPRHSSSSSSRNRSRHHQARPPPPPAPSAPPEPEPEPIAFEIREPSPPPPPSSRPALERHRHHHHSSSNNNNNTSGRSSRRAATGNSSSRRRTDPPPPPAVPEAPCLDDGIGEYDFGDEDSEEEREEVVVVASPPPPRWSSHRSRPEQSARPPPPPQQQQQQPQPRSYEDRGGRYQDRDRMATIVPASGGHQRRRRY